MVWSSSSFNISDKLNEGIPVFEDISDEEEQLAGAFTELVNAWQQALDVVTISGDESSGHLANPSLSSEQLAEYLELMSVTHSLVIAAGYTMFGALQQFIEVRWLDSTLRSYIGRDDDTFN